jgi:hypothetical protein
MPSIASIVAISKDHGLSLRPTTPAQQGAGGAALGARRGEAGRKVCQEGFAM